MVARGAVGGLPPWGEGVRSAAWSELPGQPGEALRLERAERSEAGPRNHEGSPRNY